MAEHKNQHFVPQHYLRGFSEDGRSIRLYHLGSGKIVARASLRSQCSRNYFYGADRRLENALANIEGADETALKQVRASTRLPTDAESRAALAGIAIILSGRTAKAIERQRASFLDIVTESARRFFRLHNIPAPSDAEIRSEFATDALPTEASVQSVVDLQSVVSDLRMKLLIAPEPDEFITSDHPTVITNQRFYGRTRFPSTSGFAMRGIQVFLPLSPAVCLVQYDGQCYRIGARRRESVSITRRDTETLNALQLLNCDSAVYFRDESIGPMVCRLHRNVDRQRQTRVQATQKFRTAAGGLIFMMARADVKPPAPFSFCRTITNAPTAFGPRDSEVVALYRQWGDEQKNQNEDRVSFSEWLRSRGN